MSQLKFRLLVSDIDGTLVSENGTLDQETIHSIEEYRNAGGLFTLATGRNFLHTLEIIKQLRIETPVIVSDGAMVYDPITQQKHVLSSFSRQELNWITEQIQNLDTNIEPFFLGYHSETEDHRIYGLFDNPMMRQYAKNWFYHLSLVSSLTEIQNHVKIINLFIHLKSPETVEPFRKFCQQHLQNFHVNFWPGEFVSIAPLDANKGAALLSLCKQLNLTNSQVAAIGDHLNDLPMIKNVGFFAAMENGEAEVKKRASITVPRHDEHGVAFFIRNHLLR